MTMGQNLLAVAAFLLLAHSVTADLIPTYRDEAEETGRIGVISLSGSTANYTINLTGIILLGLALSAAVTLWAYLHTLFGKGYGGSYGGSYAAASTYTDTYAANTYKRSVEDDASATLPIVLANMHQRFEDSEINDMPCRQRVMCEAAHPKNHFAQNTFGHAVNAFFRLVEDDEEMMKQVEGDKRATKYLAAWIEGKRGKSCKAAYEKCSMTFSRVDALLKSE